MATGLLSLPSRARLMAATVTSVWLFGLTAADAAPARFWFSLSETEPYQEFSSQEPGVAPGVPRVEMRPGESTTFYLWGHPQTQTLTAPYDATQNPFLQLQNVSLNIDMPDLDPAVRIDRVLFDNPGGSRYGEVLDSGEGNQQTIFTAEGPRTYPIFSPTGVERLAGFSLSLPTSSTGFGPDCVSSPGTCTVAGGVPVWRLASIDVTALAAGESDAWLQVGSMSINHVFEFNPYTRIVFGGDGPQYDPADPPRGVTLSGDLPDVLFRVSDSVPGDINGDGRVDLLDLDILGRNFDRMPATLAQGDLNGDGKVDLLDLDLLGRFFETGSDAQSVPEPAGATLLVFGIAAIMGVTRYSGRFFVGRGCGSGTFLSALALCLCVTALPTGVEAQVAIEWLGGFDNRWQIASNWSPAEVPDNGVDTYAVTIGAPTFGFSPPLLQTEVTVTSLVLNNSASELMVDGVTLTVLTPIDVQDGVLQLGLGARLDADVELSGGMAMLTLTDDVTFEDNTITLSGAGNTLALVGAFGSITPIIGADASIVLSGDGANVSTLLNDNLENRGVIRAETAGSRSVLVNDLTNEGSIHAAGGTLTVALLGAYENSGTLRVDSGATLEVFSTGDFAHAGTAELIGSGTFRADSDGDGDFDLQDTFTNAATVRPGASPGILTIEGNYEQTADGVLEIEIDGDVTPGVDFDRLVVTGAATLAGRIDLPIGYMPTDGDSATFLTAASVSGAFDRYHVTGLPADVAQRVVTTATTATVEFVDTTPTPFTSTAPIAGWGLNALDWGGMLPDSTSVVTIENNLSSSLRQTVAVFDPSIPGVAVDRNEAHRLTVGGSGGEVALVLQGAVLSVSTTTTVTSDGAIEMHGASSLLTERLLVEGGGRFAGVGTVVGDVGVGFAGVGDARFELAGDLSVEGDYEQSTRGVFELDVFGPTGGAGNDTMSLTGAATLDGVLRLDVTDLTDGEFTPGAEYVLIVAEGGVDGEFERVEQVGRDDLFFVIDYDGSGGSDSSGVALLTSPNTPTFNLEITATGFYKGDVVGSDGQIDGDDAKFFAAALIDNDVRQVDFTGDSQPDFPTRNILQALDMLDTRTDPDNQGLTIDFYDIPPFAQALATSQGVSLAEGYAMVEAAIREARLAAVPEPASGGAAALATLLSLTSRRRCGRQR